MKNTIIKTIGIGLVITLSAHAEKNKEPKAPVTKEAFLTKAAEGFDKKDLNKDGQITEDEKKALISERKARLGKIRGGPILKDDNGDGKITVEDLPEKAKPHFDKIDTNSDKQISEEEKAAAAEKMMARRAGRGGPKDTDGDGKITIKDLPEKRQGHFAKIDTNADGQLDQVELDAARAARMARKPKPEAGNQ
jgi:hypothetical protein